MRSRKPLERGIILVVIVWVASLISHGHPGGEGDAAHYLIIAHSLAFDGDLDVGNDYGPGTRLVFEGGLEPGGHVRLSGAKLRPVHDVGLPLIAAPVFRVTYRLAEQVSATLPPEFMRRSRMTPSIVLRHLIGIEMSVVAAALGVFLFRFLCALKPGHELAAACGATLIVLSPPLMPFSFAFFTELPTALLAFAGFVILWKHERPSGVVACGLGALLAFLVLMHIRNIGLASALLFLAAYRWRRQRTPLVALIAGAGSIAALRTTINYTLWGTWMSTPLVSGRGLSNGFSAEGLAETLARLGGLLFDREHGLLPYAPLYLLAPAGWYALYRQHRSLAIQLLFVVAMCLLPILTPAINQYGWRGGWSPAARFLVPIAPFLSVMVWFALVRIRPVAMVWTVVGFQVALNMLFWSDPKLMWEDGDGTSKLVARLSVPLGTLMERWPAIADAAPNLAAIAIGLALWGILSAALASRATRDA